MLRKEVGLIRKLGVRFVFNVRIGRDVCWSRLGEMSDAVLVCVGALKDTSLGIPGEDLPGVVPGYQLLESINSGKKPPIGSRDRRRRRRQLGHRRRPIRPALGRHVTVVYRRARGDMPANVDELEGALEEGVDLVCMAQPLEAVAGDAGKGAVRALKVMRMKAGGIDSSGRPAPVATGEGYEIPCDTLVIAVGERVDAAGVESIGAALKDDGRVRVDPFSLATANPKFFAAGDAVTGPATAAEAMGQARTAAAAIDAALMSATARRRGRGATARFESLFRRFEYGMEVPLAPAKAKMNARQSFRPRSGAAISSRYRRA